MVPFHGLALPRFNAHDAIDPGHYGQNLLGRVQQSPAARIIISAAVFILFFFFRSTLLHLAPLHWGAKTEVLASRPASYVSASG